MSVLYNLNPCDILKARLSVAVGSRVCALSMVGTVLVGYPPCARLEADMAYVPARQLQWQMVCWNAALFVLCAGVSWLIAGSMITLHLGQGGTARRTGASHGTVLSRERVFRYWHWPGKSAPHNAASSGSVGTERAADSGATFFFTLRKAQEA